jgi:hypothetical protein
MAQRDSDRCIGDLSDWNLRVLLIQIDKLVAWYMVELRQPTEQTTIRMTVFEHFSGSPIVSYKVTEGYNTFYSILLIPPGRRKRARQAYSLSAMWQSSKFFDRRRAGLDSDSAMSVGRRAAVNSEPEPRQAARFDSLCLMNCKVHYTICYSKKKSKEERV